jgi:hypothetical protein
MKTSCLKISSVMVTVLICSLISIFFLTGCEKLNVPGDTPSCIKAKIRDLQSGEVQNPPAKVIEWSYHGEKYYYITSDCCDQFNYLYDDNCKIVCAPDGGFTGGGSGDCPDFSDGTLTTKVIWEDDRN